MCMAITASVVPAAGSVYPSPVATYTARLRGSMVGACQIAAPAPVQSCVPAEFFLERVGGSAIAYVFQICAPVSASSATTLPRNVQQG